MSLPGLIIASDYTRHDPGDPFPARGSEDVKRIVKTIATFDLSKEKAKYS